ncbi:hypothetical protein KP509_19G021100 [Ceratopteris richardii]|uniref:Uncharacterized protein n=1 Tax=Ceratopteris richardii TaxID=49495 RepID=A0A8T2SM26_CERRI|nr:hypothetical protein KP509_19G021100 [Ceratopteris richardii]KAH7351934.1 hypothetical protein KP509_19G021100 [Ceratopteris richardii]
MNVSDKRLSNFIRPVKQADHVIFPRKARSSAIRDYPDGCVPYPQACARNACMEPRMASSEIKKPRVYAEGNNSTQKPINAAPHTIAAVGVSSPTRRQRLFGKKSVSFSPLEKCDEPGASGGIKKSPILVSNFPIRRNRSTASGLLNRLRSPIYAPMKLSTAGLSHLAARLTLKQTLRLFDAVHRNLLLEDEPKTRVHLTVSSILTENGRSLNKTAKKIGVLPGLEVGDIFYFRMELSCAGIHRPIQAGIDYLNAKDTEYRSPVAISIISSGGYEAKDEGDELIYTGQGGKNAADGKPSEDQKLERGNLAMEGSMKHGTPVRVIRGVKNAASPSGKIYVYDGLYKVEKFWSEKGKHGFEEFKFQLQRLPGQKELGSALIKLSDELKYNPSSQVGLKVNDISGGQEQGLVRVVNTIDDEMCPAPFQYTTVLKRSSGPSPFGQVEMCFCKGLCKPSKACSCIAKNGNASPYVNGLLVKEQSAILECGISCKCSMDCANKATQMSSKLRFEVFKTEDRGWGLRCQDVISAGAYVCEYTGQLVGDVDSLENKDYLLDLSILTFQKPRWGDVSWLLSNKELAKSGSDEFRPNFAIHSIRMGNVARFINHSCYPNLLVQCVFRDEKGGRWPHAMLFAMENIPPFSELTIDYGTVSSYSKEEVKGKVCKCRSLKCRGWFGY